MFYKPYTFILPLFSSYHIKLKKKRQVPEPCFRLVKSEFFSHGLRNQYILYYFLISGGVFFYLT